MNDRNVKYLQCLYVFYIYIYIETPNKRITTDISKREFSADYRCKTEVSEYKSDKIKDYLKNKQDISIFMTQ